jgi:hypothetical protein
MCPKCNHDDQIVKVSSIFSSGFSVTSQSGPGIGVGLYGGKLGIGIGGGGSSGINVSQLSMRLKPPVAPKKMGWFIIALICGAIYLVLLSIFGLNGAGPITAALISISIFVFWLISVNNKHKEKMESYQSLLNEWNKFYYCGRDDIVFTPDSRYYKTPEEMQRYFEVRS